MTSRPSAADLAAAADREVPDLLRPGLAVVFCGINPGLWSAATGHHFARPGNRFWKVLHLAGFTERQLEPDEEDLLLAHGIGITNLVSRASATAAELTRAELRAGATALASRVAQARPGCIAFLGMTAYRAAFDDPGAVVGELARPIGGTPGWLLANPSGAQARYQLADLVAQFSALRRHLDPAAASPERTRILMPPAP